MLPIYLYLGPEEGEKRAAIHKIRDSLSGDAIEEYSYFAFETPVDEIVSILRNGSLFGSATLLRLRSAESIKGKANLALLEEYVKHPAENTVLVLESTEIKVDRRLETIVGSQGKRVFWEMFEDQKERWIRAYVQRHGATIEDDAVELLLDLVENNTMELRTELDRLIAFIGEHIREEDVDRYIYHAREESVFTLFDALVAGDASVAMEILAKLASGGDVGQLIGGMMWQFERLLSLHRFRRSGLEESRLFTKQGIEMRSKRAQKTFLSAMRRYPFETSRRIVVVLNDAEEAIRTIPTPFHYGILQQVLYSILCREARWSPTASLSLS